MSFDIDMKSYAGEKSPAAVDIPVDTNSYQQEAEELPISQQEVAQENQISEQPPQDVDVNPQAGHFRALREEVDRLKAEREAEKKEHQLQIDILRANMAQQPQHQSQQQMQEKQMFDGMKDDDIPSVSDLRKEWSQREADYQSRLEELQVQQLHPDYAEVIEKFTLPLVKEKPYLADGIQSARNKALFAYELGKMSQQIHTAQPQRSQSAQKIVENARKPGTLSQAGGQSTLSKADYFASMSDAEFMKIATKNLGEI